MKKLKLQYIITFCVLDGGTLLERRRSDAKLSYMMSIPPEWFSAEKATRWRIKKYTHLFKSTISPEPLPLS